MALGLDPNLRVEQLNELSNLGYDVQAHTGNTGHTGHGGNGGNPEFNGLNVNGLISPDQASSAMVAMDWQEREAMNQRIQNQQGALLGVRRVIEGTHSVLCSSGRCKVQGETQGEESTCTNTYECRTLICVCVVCVVCLLCIEGMEGMESKTESKNMWTCWY